MTYADKFSFESLILKNGRDYTIEVYYSAQSCPSAGQGLGKAKTVAKRERVRMIVAGEKLRVFYEQAFLPAGQKKLNWKPLHLQPVFEIGLSKPCQTPAERQQKAFFLDPDSPGSRIGKILTILDDHIQRLCFAGQTS